MGDLLHDEALDLDAARCYETSRMAMAVYIFWSSDYRIGLYTVDYCEKNCAETSDAFPDEDYTPLIMQPRLR